MKAHIANIDDVGTNINGYLVKSSDVGSKHFDLGEEDNFNTPLATFDFENYNNNINYGAGFGWTNDIFNLNFWFELKDFFGIIVSDKPFLRLEFLWNLPTSAVKPWENTSVFMFAPRFFFPL
jgi:hypothetical protein